MIRLILSAICFVLFFTFFSCSNCGKYIVKFEEKNLFYAELGYDEIGFRNRCTGYFFSKEPKDIIEEYLPKLSKIDTDYYLTINYIFDGRNKDLYQLSVEDSSDSPLPLDLVGEIEFVFFKNLEIKYYNTFLNPIKKNTRRERRIIKAWITIQKINGELLIYQ